RQDLRDNAFQFFDLLRALMPPSRTPNAVNPPSTLPQNLFSPYVSDAGRPSAVVRSSVAFDPQHIALLRFRVQHGQVDPEAGFPDLAMDCVPQVQQSSKHFFFKR